MKIIVDIFKDGLYTLYRPTENIQKGSDNVIKKKVGGRPSKKPSEAELSMLYESMTATEIAEKYGVAVSTVRSWITQYRKNKQKG